MNSNSWEEMTFGMGGGGVTEKLSDESGNY